MRILPPASMLPTLLICPAWAAEFEFQPLLSVAQYYTDNVGLSPRGQEQGDWVTQAVPGLRFNYNGARLKFFAVAGAEMLYRANDRSFDVEPQWNAGTLGSMELMPQFLFLDTSSRVNQYNTSVGGPQALSNINEAGNRSTIQTWTVSPYIRHSFGSEAQAEVRYTYSLVTSDADDASFSDSGANRIDARVSSGPAYKLTGWSVQYSREVIDYATGQDNILQNFSATVRRLITPVLYLTASAGYDDNDYATASGERPSGVNWDVGLNWTPTPRTNLSATTGMRYFGRTHGLDFSHRMRRTFFRAGYTERITTTRSEFLVPTQTDTATYLDTLLLSSIPDPVARQQAVQQEIARSGLPPSLIVPVNFLTDQVFLQKSWRLSAGLQGPIHTFIANFFTSSRETQTPGLPGQVDDFNTSSTVDQIGGSLVWNWRITALTSSNVSLGLTRNETPAAGRVDDYRYFRVGLSRQLGPKTSGSILFQRLENDASVAAASYIENQVAAALQMRF